MNFRPENSHFEHTPEYIHPAVGHAYEPAKTLLAKFAINPKDFIELYGEQNVARDLASTQKKEAGFSPDAHIKYAKVLEGILLDQILKNKWFGKNTHVIKSSNYDDYFNGSDLILEMQEVSRTLSHLSLSVDVTFGTTTEEEKFKHIKANIDNETLGKIKYFHSELGGFRGELSKVPQVVIGVEKDLLIRLAGVWSNNETKSGDENHSLATHPVQRLILSEILTQLLAFRRYAHDTGKESLVPIYEKSIKIIEGIIQEKGPMDMGNLRDDKVFTSIRQSLKMFSTTK